jgi:hypothetical protein
MGNELLLEKNAKYSLFLGSVQTIQPENAMAYEAGHNTSESLLCPALQRCLTQDMRASTLAERIHRLRSRNICNKNSGATPRHSVCVSMSDQVSYFYIWILS